MNSSHCLARHVCAFAGGLLGILALVGNCSTSWAGARSHIVHESVELKPRHATGFDAFGFAVAIERDIAVVGAAEDSEQAMQSGAVYIFERNASGSWIETAKLLARDGGPCEHFGSSVALDGHTLLIGQYGVECNEAGDSTPSSIYVFDRSAAGWVQTARLQPPTGARFNFAFFTALDGKVALAGQEQTAYAYTRQAGGVWSSPTALAATASFGDDDYSGPRLDISRNTIVLGSSSIGVDTGFVDIYQAAEHRTWDRVKSITLPRPGTDFWARPHVAIEGNIILADRFVYERRRNGSWRRTATLLPSDAPAPDDFPGELALSRRGVAVLNAFEFIGADFPTRAYVYKRMPRGAWRRIATLGPEQNGARFFGRVDTDGRTVIAGGISAQGERVAYIFDVPRRMGRSRR